jgi:hypothetical protein
MLTISKLKRRSINYYIDTAQAPNTPQGIWRELAVAWGSTAPKAKPGRMSASPMRWLVGP